MYEFEMVKNAADILEAAELYGLSVTRSGMCCCPFHNEKTPSCKLYSRRYGRSEDGFHCFGCGKTGDVISLVAQIFQISQYEAARKLNDDFGFGVKFGKSHETSAKIIQKIKENQAKIDSQKKENIWIANAFKILSEYKQILELWGVWYKPEFDKSDTLNPLFVEFLTQKEFIDYLYYLILENTDYHEFSTNYKEQLCNISLRLQDIYSEELHINPDEL